MILKSPLISIIAAIGENRELGKDNKLLWHLPEDLKHFKDLTTGHVVVMGRKTYDSIGRTLPNRLNIIVSHHQDLQIAGAIVATSFQEAISIARNKEDREVFIIGGAKIYEQSIELADKLYLTVVKGKFPADVFFPDYSSFSQIISQQTPPGTNFTFLELAKK